MTAYALALPLLVLVAVEEEQAIISDIRDFRSGGMSYQEISGYLASMSIRTKQGAETWKPMTIRSILEKSS